VENWKLIKCKKGKLLGVLLSAFIAAGLLTGCQDEKTGAEDKGEYETLTIRYEGAVGTVTYPELAEDLGYLAPLKLEWIGNNTSGPAMIQNAATGQTDFGGAFNGAIIKLISQGAPIKSVIGYYGSDKETYQGYFVLEDSPIKTAKDFIGKKVGMNTMGAHAEIVLREYLKQNGLTDKEIEQVTMVVIPPVNAEQALKEGQIDVAVLSGMIRDRALEKGGIRKVFSDYDLFGSFTAGSYVFTEKFMEENPNTVRKFVEGTAKAIDWAQTTPREEVIARFEKIIKERNRKEDTETIQYYKSTGIAEKGGYIQENEFQTWLDWLEENGDIKKGQVSLEDVYTNEFNPYQNEIEKNSEVR
jgi:ABC-type nitrate/sulfonate/bicarbonate transport system substrate-binding protein